MYHLKNGWEQPTRDPCAQHSVAASFPCASWQQSSFHLRTSHCPVPMNDPQLRRSHQCLARCHHGSWRVPPCGVFAARFSKVCCDVAIGALRFYVAGGCSKAPGGLQGWHNATFYIGTEAHAASKWPCFLRVKTTQVCKPGVLNKPHG